MHFNDQCLQTNIHPFEIALKERHIVEQHYINK